MLSGSRIYALVMAMPGVVATAGYASCEPPARLIPPGLPPGRNLVDDPAFAEAPWLRTCDNPENVDALRGVSQDAYKRGPRQQAAQKRISREFFDRATCAFHGARLVSPRGCFPARAGSVVERSGATLRFSFSGAALAACRVGEPSTFRVRYEATAATWFPRGSQGSRPLSITARLRSNSTTTIATLRRATNATLLAGSFEGRFVAPSAGAQVLEVLLSWLVDEPRPLPRPGAFHEQLLYAGATIAAGDPAREQRPSCATPSGAAALRRAARDPDPDARGGVWWHADADHGDAFDGDAAFISDEARYNDGWIYRPHACVLRYASSTAQFVAEVGRRCRTNGPVVLAATSDDSLGRELWTNMAALFSGENDHRFNEQLDGRKTRDAASWQAATTLDFGAVRIRQVRKASGTPPAGAAGWIFAPRIVMALFNPNGEAIGPRIRGVLDAVEAFGRSCGRRFGARRDLACVVYLNPTLQREDHRRHLPGARSKDHFFVLRRETVARVVDQVRRKAFALGLGVADAEALTAPRWDATWDGCHYSRGVHWPDARGLRFRYQWQGGVSRAATILFLNNVLAACNDTSE